MAVIKKIKNKTNEALTKSFSTLKKKFKNKTLDIIPIITGTVVIKNI